VLFHCATSFRCDEGWDCNVCTFMVKQCLLIHLWKQIMLDTKLPRTVFSVAIRGVSNMNIQCNEAMKTCTVLELSSTYQVWQKMKWSAFYFGLVTAGEIVLCTLFYEKMCGPRVSFCACNWIPNIQPVVALLNETCRFVCISIRDISVCVMTRQAPLRTVYFKLQIRGDCGVSHSSIAFWH